MSIRCGYGCTPGTAKLAIRIHPRVSADVQELAQATVRLFPFVVRRGIVSGANDERLDQSNALKFTLYGGRKFNSGDERIEQLVALHAATHTG